MQNEANAFTEWSTKQIHHFADIKIDVASEVDFFFLHSILLTTVVSLENIFRNMETERRSGKIKEIFLGALPIPVKCKKGNKK